jgi:hypothetical protein
VHENAYVSHSHHCFGDAAFPGAGSPPPLTALPVGVTAHAADEARVHPAFASRIAHLTPSHTRAPALQGVSCATACAAAGKACVAEALPSLNNCDHLRAAFPCEAGCEPASGAELPAYMSGAVTDASTMCRTDNGSSGPRTCEAAAANTRRLCPCK